MKIHATQARAYLEHCRLLLKLSAYEDALVNGNAELAGHELYAKIRRIELKAHRNNEANYNGFLTEEQSERYDKTIRDGIKKLLPKLGDSFYLNGDPRGYALKTTTEYARKLYEDEQFSIYRDFGGYGILAPDFSAKW